MARMVLGVGTQGEGRRLSLLPDPTQLTGTEAEAGSNLPLQASERVVKHLSVRRVARAWCVPSGRRGVP